MSVFRELAELEAAEKKIKALQSRLTSAEKLLEQMVVWIESDGYVRDEREGSGRFNKWLASYDKYKRGPYV